jgi:class 3 adenylate cyclase
MEPSSEVAALLVGFYARWNAINEGRDDPRHEDLWADEFTSIGTDPEEFSVVVKSLQPHRSMMKRQVEEYPGGSGPMIVAGDIRAWAEGLIGWVVDRPRWIFGDRPDVALRLSAVARREPRGWRFVHLHLSIGVPNEESLGMRLTTSVDELVEGDLSAELGRALPRHEVTIVFSDIESSTATLTRLGERDWVDLLLRHNRIVRHVVLTMGGSEVKTQGDGFMLAFTSAESALRCMLELRRQFGKAFASEPVPVRVRMGAHSGEAVKRLGDYHGETVVTAARIAAQAGGDELLVSDATRRLAGTSFAFGERRSATLKGLRGTYEMWPLIDEASDP